MIDPDRTTLNKLPVIQAVLTGNDDYMVEWGKLLVFFEDLWRIILWIGAMATLKGKHLSRRKWFSISPSVSEQIDRESYEYIFSHGESSDRPLVTYRILIDGWFEGVYELLRLARLFQSAENLITVQIPVIAPGRELTQPGCLYINCDWIKVIAYVPRSKKFKRLNVELFVSRTSYDQIFEQYFLQADIEDAKVFGLKLEEEILSMSSEWDSSDSIE